MLFIFNTRFMIINSYYTIYANELIGSFILFSSVAFAGTSAGVPSNLIVHEGDVFMFTAGPAIDQPACAPGNSWAISLKTPKGRGMQAFIMWAAALGKSVNVQGANDCNDSPDRERPYFVHTP